eukprot:s43_g21.t1
MDGEMLWHRTSGDLGQSPAVAQLVAVGVMHFVLWRAKGVAAAATVWSMAGGGGGFSGSGARGKCWPGVRQMDGEVLVE